MASLWGGFQLTAHRIWGPQLGREGKGEGQQGPVLRIHAQNSIGVPMYRSETGFYFRTQIYFLKCLS